MAASGSRLYKMGLTSLNNSYGLQHLYICCSPFSVILPMLLHSCLWRALDVVFKEDFSGELSC